MVDMFALILIALWQATAAEAQSCATESMLELGGAPAKACLIQIMANL